MAVAACSGSVGPSIPQKGKELARYAYLEPEGQVTVLKIAHEHPTYHPQHKALLELFQPEVEMAEEGIKVELYPAGSLGTEEEFLKGIQQGTVEMGIFTRLMPELVPSFSVFYFPYLFESRSELGKSLEQEGKKFTFPLASMGMTCLAFSAEGFQNILTNAVTTPQIPQDLSFWVMRNPASVQYARLCGYQVDEMEYDTLWNWGGGKKEDGFHIGLLEGYYGGIIGKETNIYMVQDIPIISAYVMNYGFFYSQTEDQQLLLMERAKASAAQAGRWTEEQETEVRLKLQQKGVRFFEEALSDSEKRMQQQACREWAEQQEWAEELNLSEKR